MKVVKSKSEKKNTPKTDMDPRNDVLEEEIPFQHGDFGVHVTFRGCDALWKRYQQIYSPNGHQHVQATWRHLHLSIL